MNVPNNGPCKKGMTFDECELAVLRLAVDKAEMRQGGKFVHTPEIQKMIQIVEQFIKKQHLVCYGGTAINNILPKNMQFYNPNVEVPDYDFFSPNAPGDAKKLADEFIRHQFTEVEAKSGVHHGTYKVFVNYVPIADITHIPKELFQTLKTNAIKRDDILYAPPNFLRMSLFLELSRPNGDVTRWEKVLKRLILINKQFPITDTSCKRINFQREMTKKHRQNRRIYTTILDTFLKANVVFFGGYALTHYSQYMPSALKRKFRHNPDFDVLSETPEKTANLIKRQLIDAQIPGVSIVQHEAVGELISPHYEIKVGDDTVAFIYEPMACHSYNTIKVGNQWAKIATIDTILSFYLAFLYINRPYYDPDRIICMANYLFKVQEKNRLKQKGILKRFSLNCIGHQPTKEEMRALKTEKHKALKKGTEEYEEWFMNYRPKGASARKSRNSRKKSALPPAAKKTRKNVKWMPSFLGQ